ncbi:hypothetical protein FRC08_006257 [Ceratobasidium sp. 394]|nr:hypothetical protein FRC08_006257 [Ceratobasidium sp. 394]
MTWYSGRPRDGFFEYPISRAYPWRFTTIVVFLASFAILGALFYVNVAIVGLTSYTRYSSEFIPWGSPSWADRLRISSVANRTVGCESATLVSGGTYQTPNGAFTYTIQSLYDGSTGTPTSNANYNSSELSNCRVDTITLSAAYATYEASFDVTVNCSLKENIELTATTTSIVRVPWIEKKSDTARVTPLAGNTTQLLTAFGSDFFEDVLFSGRALLWPKNIPLGAIFYVYRLNANATIDWIFGSFSAAGWVTRNPGPNGFRLSVSPSSVQACENYLRMLSASILSDLGVVSQQNPLTNADAFKAAIQPLDWAWRGNTSLTPFANLISGPNMTTYNIPYNFVRPTSFNAQYLCHYISWKATSNLIVDVFVATSSLFTLFWGTLHVSLAFFAKKKSPKGNYCVCPNCDIPINPHSDAIKLLQRSKSNPYERLPNSAL